jgi:hypothetical protein
MSKQIIYNQEKNALFFQNNEIQYKIDLTCYKQSQINFNSQYDIIDSLEKKLISIYSNIDRMEKRLKPINKVLNKISIEYGNTVISCTITFEVNEFELIADEYGNFEFAIDLEKITFNEVVTTPLLEPDFLDIINLDINEINSIGSSLFYKLQTRYKNCNVIFQLDNVSFHRPNQNTIESF